MVMEPKLSAAPNTAKWASLALAYVFARSDPVDLLDPWTRDPWTRAWISGSNPRSHRA